MCIIYARINMIFLETQGELFEILEDDKYLPEEQVQAIAKQLVLSPFEMFPFQLLISLSGLYGLLYIQYESFI